MNIKLYLLFILIFVCDINANLNSNNNDNYEDDGDSEGISDKKNYANNARQVRQVNLRGILGSSMSEYKGKFKISLPSVNHKIEDIFSEEIDKNDISSNHHKPKVELKKENNGPIVATAEGLVRGILAEKYGVKYYSFLGMRYAEKPIRFKAPERLKPWSGIKDHTKEGETCIQQNEWFDDIGGSEDCLFVNINTPTLEDKKLPVIVWIHGGLFRYGSGSVAYYGPERLTRKEVVVVTINYRLGPFGFLSTGTSHAPGNAGMKDIIESLRWLNRNIHMFGGDTYNICLYGISSGGSLVDFITLSPMAKGLFTKAIIHSGVSLSYWSFNREPLKNAFQLGKILGINTMDLNVLMDRLNTFNSSEMIIAAKKIEDEETPFHNYIPFSPCAEEILPGEIPFLTDSPENIFKSGNYNHVPIMLGYNDKEGLNNMRRVENVTNYINSIDNIFDFVIPLDLFESITSPVIRRDIKNKVKMFYFKNETIGLKTLNGFIDLYGDVTFLYGIHKTAEYRAQHIKSPIYYYEFAYDGKLFKDVENINGAAHTDDMHYIFIFPIPNPKFESNNVTLRVSNQYVTMITNFMKFGDPIPKTSDLLPIKWNSIVDKDNHDYLKITDKLEMKKNPNKERYELWSKIYSLNKN